jgi:hypothetical protein
MLMAAPLVRAGLIGQANTPSGSAFASACAGYVLFSGIGDPGLGYNYQENGASGAGYNCSNMTAASGPAYANVALAGGYHVGILNQDFPYNSTASSSAQLGMIHVQSSNASEPIVEFPGGGGDGGWNDTVTINAGLDPNGNPIGTPGSPGQWVFPVHVSGTLSQTGGARGVFLVAPYLNLTRVGPDYFPGHPANLVDALTAYNNLNVTHNGTVGSVWDFEMSEWAVSDPLTSLTVDADVWFVIPFTFGTSFELGIYAADLSAETGFGFDPSVTASSVDFSHTLTYGGPGYVISNGVSSTSFDLGSTSGFNYNQAFTPEPGTWGLLVLGVGLIWVARRK